MTGFSASFWKFAFKVRDGDDYYRVRVVRNPRFMNLKGATELSRLTVIFSGCGIGAGDRLLAFVYPHPTSAYFD